MCVQERVVINILHGLLIKVTFLLITYISSQFFSGNTLKMQVAGYFICTGKIHILFPFTQNQNNNNNNKKPTQNKKQTKPKAKTKQNKKQKKNQKSNQKLNLHFLAMILFRDQ